MTDTTSRSMSERVANNTAIGLIEVATISLVSIYYIRLLYRTLGEDDYGIFTALGASGLFSVIVIAGFNTAALRFLALSIGAGDAGNQRATMASTVVLYLGITIVLGVVAVAFRNVILDALTIPAERAGAARTLYWSVVGQFCIGSAVAPFAALRQAHQRFGLLALYEVAQRVAMLVFLIVLAMRPELSNDALRGVAYVAFAAAAVRGALVVAQTMLMLSGGRFSFGEASFGVVRSIAGFARWSILNSISVQGRNQFAVVLLNIAFGTAVNAAYALGLSANAMVQRFARSFNKSLQPAMTSLYGSDNDRDFAGLISVGCRYAALVLIAPLATLLTEMDNFLTLWIGDTPPSAALYARLISFATFSRMFSSGYSAAINATDKMRAGTILGVGVDIITIAGGMFAIFVAGAPAWSLPTILIAGNWIRNIVFAGFFGPSYGFTVWRWLCEVVWPLVLSFFIVLGAASAAGALLDASLVRLALVALVSLLATAGTVRWIVSSAPERVLLMRWVGRLTGRRS